jgi:phosphoribosylanthranilate isomerase
MIVQIYAAMTAADALTLAGLGVDHIGFVAGDYGQVHAELNFSQARAIAEALRGKAKSSALTMSPDWGEILRMARAVRPDIVHISSDTEAVDTATMRRLRQELPHNILLMKAVHVSDASSIETGLRFAEVADIILLDTKVAGLPGVGATGVTHDWRISAEIIRRIGAKARVILAGGLTPENVAAAVEMTRPWGVDSNTGTNLPHDPVTKDMGRVKAFVQQAKTTTD